MKMITFDKFKNLINQIYHENEFELRYGQVVMNLLYQVWPEKYHQISHGQYDCFYDDDLNRHKSETLLQMLQKEWPNEI